MRRDCIQILVACTILSMGRPAIRAAEFAGGKGEPNDPYLIATAEQLIAIGSDSSLLSKHFLMIQDIDLDPNLSAAYAFDQAVIGGGFRGVFDGGGFLIRHLTIRASEDGATGGRGSWLGLFRTIEQYGEVRHVVLDEVDILGSPDRDYVGALCSANKGVLRQCFVGGTVFGWTVGGMVGWNQPDGSVQECGSVCTVSGTYSGGLIGSNHGWAEDSYASGAVSGTQCGGLVAEAAYGSRISRCYASCRVISVGPYSGGLIGTAYPGTVADGCFFLGYRDGGGPDNGIGRALTLDQMKQVASFVGWEFWGTGNDGFRAPWSMPEDGYPELTWLALGAIPGIRGLSTEEAWKALAGAGIQTCYVTYDYDPAVEYGHAVVARPNLIAPAGRAADVLVSLGCYDWSANSGTGEPNDPYLILSPGQLECLAVQPRLWSKCFRLISDLDMAWRVHKRPLIGIGGAFSGVFEGDGYLIRNLTFETRGPDGNWSKMLGLFGEVGPLGSIVNLGLRDVSIRGEKDMQEAGGMLCAINRGSIARCYAIGEVLAQGTLAGFVGKNAGLIEDCYVQGVVDDLGGRSDPLYDAGLVVDNTGGTIRTCYSTCFVQTRHNWGLVAHNEGGTVERCLWDVQASGVQTSAAGTGLSTQEMMSVQVLRDHGWGDNPYWVLNDGKDYPRLVWERQPGASELGPGR